MITALVLFFVTIGTILGYWMAQRERWWAFFAFLIIAALVFFWVVLLVQRRPERTGFEGVAEVALAVLMIGPLELGALIGAGVSRIRKRRG